MLHRLFGLRHDTVIRGHNQNHDIGNRGTTCTHRRKGGVPRGIQEGHQTGIRLHLIGANVLGNAASLTRGHTGFTDVVEQGGLTMVNVTHDRHHRRTRFAVQGVHIDFADFLEQVFLFVLGADRNGFVTHFLDHQLGGVLIQAFIDGGHHAHAHQNLDQFGSLDGHALGQITHGDRVRNFHVTDDRRRRPLKPVLGIHLDSAATTGRTFLAPFAALVLGHVQLFGLAFAPSLLACFLLAGFTLGLLTLFTRTGQIAFLLLRTAQVFQHAATQIGNFRAQMLRFSAVALTTGGCGRLGF